MDILEFNIEKDVRYNSCGIMKTDVPWKHSPRIFDLWVLSLCTSGTMFMNIEGEEYTIRPGDVFIFPVRRLHYGTRDCEGVTSYYWAHFEGPDLEKILCHSANDEKKLSKDHSYFMYHIQLLDINTVSMLFNQLYSNEFAQHYTPNLQGSLLKALMYEISNQTLYSHAHKFDQRFMNILNYIRSHFTDNLTVDLLSEEFGYNKSYLCRLFKSKLNKTIKGYQNELRISFACQLLSETCLPIKSISSQAGYESEKYFVRLFKKMMNTTPTKYRNMHSIATFKELPV